MKKDRLILIVIFLLIAIIAGYNIISNSLSFSEVDSELHLSADGKKFIDDNPIVRTTIYSKLGDYNINDSLMLFVDNYLDGVFKGTGLVSEVTDESKSVDGYVAVIDDEIRNNYQNYMITMPIARVSVDFFVNTSNANIRMQEASMLRGVYVKGTLTEVQKRRTKYNGYRISWVPVDDAVSLKEYLLHNDIDCLIADELTYSYLDSKLGNYNLTVIKPGIKFENVCYMTESKELYDIVNDIIYENGVDNRALYTTMSEFPQVKVNANDSNSRNNSEYAIIVVIMLLAVLIAFFVYYQTNINLYNELTDRMNQIIESQGELNATFKSVPFYLAKIDRNGIISDMNKNFEFQKEFGESQNYIGENVKDIINFSKDDKVIIDNMIKDARDNVANDYHEAKEMILGRQIMEVRIVPIEILKGYSENYLFIAKDITDEKVARRQFLQDSKMIAIGQLAAGVAHEIRNPLGLIRNYCYVIKSPINDAKIQKQAIDKIEEAVASSSRIIENLLNFSRLSSNEIEKIKIRNHINDTLEINHNKLKKRNITLNIECSEELIVEMYVESFNMILINLVTNSIDAVEDNGRIDIIVEDQKNSYTISVTDNGVGIAKENLEEIFNPFYTDKVREKGTGLGLYIVYNEIKKLNGRIRVESIVGEGSTFIVTLPKHY